MAALTSNTSAIAFAGFALASFLSLSVWVFPPQQTQAIVQRNLYRYRM
jgi:hypothetical protein